MPVNPESNSSPTRSQPQEVRFPAATPDVILELVRSSRLAQSSNSRTETRWTKLDVAWAMFQRGIAHSDIMRALGLTVAATGFWVANQRRWRVPCHAQQQVVLWAAMLQQADPRKRMQAEQVVCADCSASVEWFREGGFTHQTDCCTA